MHSVAASVAVSVARFSDNAKLHSELFAEHSLNRESQTTPNCDRHAREDALADSLASLGSAVLPQTVESASLDAHDEFCAMDQTKLRANPCYPSAQANDAVDQYPQLRPTNIREFPVSLRGAPRFFGQSIYRAAESNRSSAMLRER